MLTPEDKKYIDDAIATRLDIMSAFRDLPEAFKEEIANDIGAYVYQRQRALREPENTYTPRWTVDMADVNEDDAGVEKGHTGPTLPRWIDIIGGTAHLDGDDPQILHFRAGGGGADCMFDYLVSECWADEVAAGRGVEGQTMTSITGCTFRVYSTVQAAINHWEASSPSGAVVFFICGGTYNEDIVLTNATHEIHIYGAGADRTILGGNAGQFNAAGAIDCYLHNVTLSGPAAGYSMTNAFASNMRMHCFNVTFRRKMGGDHAGSEFYDCTWEGGLSFNSAIDEPEHVRIYGGRVSTVGIDFSTTNGVRGWNVRGLMFLTNSCTLTYGDSVSDTDLEILFATGGGTLSKAVNFKAGGSYGGNRLKAMFRAPASTDTVINVEDGAEVYNSQIHAEFDAPEAGAASSTAYIKTAGAGFFYGSEFIVTFRRNSLGNYIEDLGTHQSISGDFRRCAFVITPTNAEVTLSGSSVGNVFLGGVITSGGSGVAYAHRIQDADNDTYVSTEESADSDVIESASGGTIRSRLSALGLQLANGTDLLVYSDAFSSLLASIDGATGHANLGSSATPDINTILGLAGTKTPTSTFSALAASPVISLTGTNANTVAAFNTSVTFATDGSARTQSGIAYGTLANLLVNANATVNDYRNFQAQVSMGASATSTMVDRYGFRVNNATGAGSVTNQYGVYIENMTKGGTINRAIQSLGGLSTHLGAIRFGSNTAPTNTTNGDITGTRLIVPDATIVHSAISQLGGPVVIPSQGALRFSDSDNSHYTGFKAHATTTASVEYTWPAADGTSGYQLTTDGAGVLSWAAAGSGGGGGHTIQDDNSSMTARTNLSFQDGFVLTDDAGGDQTEVDLSYAGTGDIANVAATEAAGSAITAARGDHVHALGIGTTRGDLIVWNSTPVASRLAIGANRTILKSDGTDASWGVNYKVITYVIDNGGFTITTGIKGDLEIPFGCTITRATALADQSGSIVVDIWKDTYANYPPTDADSITASAPVTISSATKSQDSTLTGWTTSITAGDTLRFNVDSVTTITRVTISLRVEVA